MAGLGGAHHLTAHHHLAAEAPAVDGDHPAQLGIRIVGPVLGARPGTPGRTPEAVGIDIGVGVGQVAAHRTASWVSSSMRCQRLTKSGIVLETEPMSSSCTPGTISPISAARCASR
ncbi:hypothetical protein SDC9_205676 [bioreactor metagenome]|uniref:Uncharacterized protein n=1 Tax=bioreactor metagenome TaxID=1076179 RepID=A0A645J4B9_9ZZZZ